MRLAGLFLLSTLLVAGCAAQDTNFAAGPQYLITYGSPLLLHSIATPTLNLEAPLPDIQPFLSDAGASPAESAAPAVFVPSGGLARMYWGEPTVSVIEITSAPLIIPVPASLLDGGVTGMMGASSNSEQGNGIPLGDIAAFWKARRAHASRTYSNSDVDRLHRG